MNIVEKFYLKSPRSLLFLFMVFSPMIIHGFLSTVFGNDFDSLEVLIFFLIYIGWYYVLGLNLFDKVPDKLKFKKTFFEINIGYSFLFIVIMSLLSEFSSFSNISGSNPFIFPFAFYNLFALGYTIYFVSKALFCIQYDGNMDTAIITGYMFLFFFFPVGILVLQPKINKVFKYS
jgi:hypothetical protein